MASANQIAQSIRDRIAAGGDLLQPGQWIAELTRVNREDGTRGAHVSIGYRGEFGGAHQTVALPVNMGDDGRGVQLVAAEAADAIAADVAREAAEDARDQQQARAESAENARDQQQARAAAAEDARDQQQARADAAEDARDEQRDRAEAAETARDQQQARANAAESLATERAATIAEKQARIDELEAQQTTQPVKGGARP